MNQESKDFRELTSADAPDDVATLYSWANLRGAKYRDFSASRREHRAQMRARLQAEAARSGAESTTPALADQPLVPSASSEPRHISYVREFGGPQPAPPYVSPSPYQPSPYQPAPGTYAPREATPMRPAWLYSEEVQQPSTKQDRWSALRGVFDRPQTVHGEAHDLRMPVIAILSLAGGVGKTSLVATLGRALSSFGERTLLVEASPYGLLPYYFGSRETRPGVVRTFTPPAGTPGATVHMISLDADQQTGESAQEPFSDTIRAAAGTQCVLIDATTASGPMAKQIMRVATMVIVPIVPDLNSVMSIHTVDSFFRQQTSGDGRTIQPYYLLNQFDASLPLHQDLREVLRRQLGDRLLPGVVRRSPAVSEGLAEGMTVVDYAPNSPVTEDYLNLATWLRSSASSSASARGNRWSER